LAESLREAAAVLTATVQHAGPAAQMWCPVPGGGTAFYARRFVHETAIHRSDAALAMGVPYALDTDVAGDGVEEWLELGSMPFHFEVHPWMRELLGPGRWPCIGGCRSRRSTSPATPGLVDFWLERVAFG
jgi:hypothetical protein